MNGFDKRTVFEKMSKPLPEYHETMYLEGYTPDEILQSARRTIMANQ